MSHQSLSPFSEKHEVPSPKCIEIHNCCLTWTRKYDRMHPYSTNHSPLQRKTWSAISEVHWIYGTAVWLEYENRSQVPSSHRSFSPFREKHEVPSPKCIAVSGLLDWNTSIRSINRYTLTTFPEQIIYFIPFGNSISAVNLKLQYDCRSTIERNIY